MRQINKSYCQQLIFVIWGGLIIICCHSEQATHRSYHILYYNLFKIRHIFWQIDNHKEINIYIVSSIKLHIFSLIRAEQSGNTYTILNYKEGNDQIKNFTVLVAGSDIYPHLSPLIHLYSYDFLPLSLANPVFLFSQYMKMSGNRRIITM